MVFFSLANQLNSRWVEQITITLSWSETNTQKMSHQNSCFYVIHIAITIVLASTCVDGHEKSANFYVNRMKRLTDNGSLQLQQWPHSNTNTDINSNPKNVLTLNHYSTNNNNNNNDKIVFDRVDYYGMTNTQSPITPMTISRDLSKFNETNHQYTGKANGEYEFRWIFVLEISIKYIQNIFPKKKKNDIFFSYSVW